MFFFFCENYSIFFISSKTWIFCLKFLRLFGDGNLTKSSTSQFSPLKNNLTNPIKSNPKSQFKSNLPPNGSLENSGISSREKVLVLQSGSFSDGEGIYIGVGNWTRHFDFETRIPYVWNNFMGEVIFYDDPGSVS